jgi:AmmeMemoRadiSam system protein B
VRHFFPRAKLLMIGVAASEIALDIGRRTGELARDAGRNAVFVGSTDLTHYGPNYDFAPAGSGRDAVAWTRDTNDAGFIDAVLADDPARALEHARTHQSACCPGAAIAAIEALRAYQGRVSPALVEHYLSYDIQPSASFVGYAGIAI